MTDGGRTGGFIRVWAPRKDTTDGQDGLAESIRAPVRREIKGLIFEGEAGVENTTANAYTRDPPHTSPPAGGKGTPVARNPVYALTVAIFIRR